MTHLALCARVHSSASKMSLLAGFPRAPAGQPIGRLDARAVRAAAPVGQLPLLYVCGPTGFVEAVASALVDAGHQEALIRTERFGPSGG